MTGGTRTPSEPLAKPAKVEKLLPSPPSPLAPFPYLYSGSAAARLVPCSIGGAICAVSLGDPVSRKTSSVLYSPSPPCSRLSDRCRRNGGISSASGLTQPQQTFQSVFLLCSKPFSWRTNCAIPHELGLVGRERGSKLLFGAVAGEKNSAAAWLK